MRRITVSQRGVETGAAPVPQPAPDEVRVRAGHIGVCGSDTHALHGRHPFISLPYAPGHEVVGVVDHVGADVHSVAVGQRVVVEPTLPCWRCKQCVNGRHNLCENLRFFGCVHDQGGMADFFTIPANRLHPVPAHFSDLQAVLIEPLSTPVHAARLAGELQDKAVVIFGAGTIGLLLLATVLRAGPRRVVVTDVLPAKRERASALGAHAVIDAAGPDVAADVCRALGESADVVFDCVAVQATVTQAVHCASKGGTVVIVGVPATPVTVDLPLLQDQQIRIQGSATYLPEDYADAIELLTAGDVDPADFVTATFSLDDAAAAFAAADSGEHIKVVVNTA